MEQTIKPMKQGYAIVLEPLNAADGGGWLASVPALPGCLGDGDTPEAALTDAEAAMAEWLDAAAKLQRPIPATASLGQWRQRVPRSLHEKLKIVAAREGVSLNAFVANVLAEAVGKRAVG
jgi:antitoxin HicB